MSIQREAQPIITDFPFKGCNLCRFAEEAIQAFTDCGAALPFLRNVKYLGGGEKKRQHKLQQQDNPAHQHLPDVLQIPDKINLSFCVSFIFTATFAFKAVYMIT